MKLTITRTKQEHGIFKKTTVFYLEVQVATTPEETALLRGDVGLQCRILCGGSFHDPCRYNLNAGDVVGKRTSWAFKTIDDLENIERQLIGSLRGVKETFEKRAEWERSQIERTKQLKQQAAEFRSEGPREIDL